MTFTRSTPSSRMLAMLVFVSFAVVFQGWDTFRLIVHPLLPTILSIVPKSATNATENIQPVSANATLPVSTNATTFTLPISANATANDSESRDTRFHVSSNDSNNSSSSPSTWWPTDDWLRACAEKQAELPLQPFPVSGIWRDYRLGDCIKLCVSCRDDDSLAGEYNRRACSISNSTFDHNKMYHPNYMLGGNLTVVEEILHLRDSTEGFLQPAEEELAIHLRLGDVIENSRAKVAEMLVNGGNANHSANFDGANSIKSVYEYLSDIQQAGDVVKVAIVGGSHKPHQCKKSRVYAACLQQSIEGVGYEVEMKLDSGHPDQDFYYMAHAKMISVSTGGYSRLVGRIAVRKGGFTVGRTFR